MFGGADSDLRGCNWECPKISKRMEGEGVIFFKDIKENISLFAY